MSLHTRFLNAVLKEMKNFLTHYYSSLDAAPKELSTEIRNIATRLKKTTDPMQIRNILLAYIESVSSFWRVFAFYSNYNKLRSKLESVINQPEFSLQSIQINHARSLHKHYLRKQNELITPLKNEIYSLQATCENLKDTVSSLKEENQRLRVENDFFMNELISMQEKLLKKEPQIEKKLPEDTSFDKLPPTPCPLKLQKEPSDHLDKQALCAEGSTPIFH